MEVKHGFGVLVVVIWRLGDGGRDMGGVKGRVFDGIVHLKIPSTI